jgi:hypothetical protein
MLGGCNVIVKILGYVGMGVLVATLAVTVHSTIALAQVDMGLNRSLDTTAKLATIEQSIIQKNRALAGVIQTATSMSGRLATTVRATQGIDTNIHSINRLNKLTLRENKQMVKSTAASEQTLKAIATHAKGLKSYIEALNQYLSTLEQTTSSDKTNLAAMERDTNTMDQKVPGVTK